MKIVLVSDTHSKHKQITKDLPEGDCIVCAGDISTMGYKQEIKDFLDWFSSLNYDHKIFIAGNHDWGFQESASECQEILSNYPGVTYLENSGVEIEGIRFWGSPYTPEFYNWAFNVPRGKLDKHWDLIPEGTDVLITHGPPNGHGDIVSPNPRYNIGNHAGCEQLLERIEKVKPKFHIFGHIHSGNGVTSNRDTIFINASVLDDRYRYTYLPRVIELERKIDGEIL